MIKDYKNRIGKPVLYFICTMLYAFGILLAVQFPSQKATIIQLMIALVPIFIVDNPLRTYIYSIAVLISYILIVVFCQDKSILFKECFNAVSLTVLAMVCHWIMGHSRLKNYLAENNNQKVIKQLKAAQEELRLTSESDALTGLLNRRKLYQTLGEINKKQEKTPEGLMMIDIDNFKQINDKYGHAKGDYILSCFSSELKKLEQNNLLNSYRYGGDEFVVLVWDYQDATLCALADEIHLIGKNISIDKSESLSLSIGVYLCSQSEKPDCEKWLDKADQAAYLAKQNGRGRTIYGE